MKKGTLKKVFATGVMGVMAFTMPFAITGCEKPENIIKTDAEAYVMLRDFVAEYKVVNQEGAHHTLVQFGNNTRQTFDFEQSKLHADTIAMLQTGMGMSDAKRNYNGKVEYSVNNDNTGYMLSQTYNFGAMLYETDEFSGTFLEDDQYINYQYDSLDGRSKYIVDNEFAGNAYKLTKTNLENYSGDVVSFWNSFEQYETLESYLENKNSFAAEILSKSAEIEIDANDLIVSVDMDYKDGEYILKAVILSDGLEYSEDGLVANVDLFATISISFNDDGITGTSAKMDVKQYAEVPAITFAIFDPEKNADVTEAEMIYAYNTIYQNFSADYNADLNDEDFISNIMPIQDLFGNLEAEDDVHKITVTLKDDDGSVFSNVEFYSNQKISSADLPRPSKEGYTFYYWEYENGSSFNSSKLSENTTLVATYRTN